MYIAYEWYIWHVSSCKLIHGNLQVAIKGGRKGTSLIFSSFNQTNKNFMGKLVLCAYSSSRINCYYWDFLWRTPLFIPPFLSFSLRRAWVQNLLTTSLLQEKERDARNGTSDYRKKRVIICTLRNVAGSSRSR